MSPRPFATCWDCGASYVDREDGVDSVMCDGCRREASDELEAALCGPAAGADLMSALLTAGQVEHITDMAALTATALAAFGELDEQARAEAVRLFVESVRSASLELDAVELQRMRGAVDGLIALLQAGKDQVRR